MPIILKVSFSEILLDINYTDYSQLKKRQQNKCYETLQDGQVEVKVMIPPQRALLVATMCLPSPPMRLGSGVNTRPSLYSLSLHVRVSSLAARSVPSCCWLDGNRSNKLCVDVVKYLNFLDRSFEKGESDKRGINIAWRRPWSLVCGL